MTKTTIYTNNTAKLHSGIVYFPPLNPVFDKTRLCFLLNLPPPPLHLTSAAGHPPSQNKQPAALYSTSRRRNSQLQGAQRHMCWSSAEHVRCGLTTSSTLLTSSASLSIYLFSSSFCFADVFFHFRLVNGLLMRNALPWKLKKQYLEEAIIFSRVASCANVTERALKSKAAWRMQAP